MDGYSAAQVRAAERPLLEAGEPLMARAAAGLAAEVRRRLRARLAAAGRADRGRVLLLVGSGSNGGDALFAGAELAAEGVEVTSVALGSRVHEDGSAAATGAGVATSPVDDWQDPATARARLRGVDVVVDGILGTGTGDDPALRGAAAAVVAALLPALAGEGAPIVVACDLPSGTGPDDGAVPSPVVLPAAVTVTFGACKAGLLLAPARDLAGEVVVVDIGLGPQLAGQEPLVRG
ncbi:NAD(P)H-hydrate epimerase [Frigoribacterium salinisoli]